ncbi:MAG: hypothetical protein D6788_07865 [Planctomycetota bacterium]|nr:MAG: hypothetical protein D6788_07865 [Planctomycetota bacterium]
MVEGIQRRLGRQWEPVRLSPREKAELEARVRRLRALDPNLPVRLSPTLAPREGVATCRVGGAGVTTEA